MPSGLGLEGYANIYSVGFATDKLITLEDGPGPHVYSYIAMVRDLNHPHALPIFTWENLEHTIVARRTVAQAAVHERENDQSRHWLNRMQASWTDFKKRNKTFTRLKNTGVERLRTDLSWQEDAQPLSQAMQRSFGFQSWRYLFLGKVPHASCMGRVSCLAS